MDKGRVAMNPMKMEGIVEHGPKKNHDMPPEEKAKKKRAIKQANKAAPKEDGGFEHHDSGMF